MIEISQPAYQAVALARESFSCGELPSAPVIALLLWELEKLTTPPERLDEKH